MAEAVPAAGGGTRYTESRRVTLVSLAVNLVLAAVKIVTGWLAASHALVADGVHSLSDLLTDVVVIVAAREASRRPDARHPYGHGRFETAVTLGLGLVLVVTGIGIAYDSAIRMQHLDRLAVPGVAALGVALVAIVAKEALYHYTMRTARRINSKLLRANAWHHRSDSISTVVVLGGIVGSQLGFPWLDPLAAIAVAVTAACGREAARAKVGVARAEVVAHGSKRTLVRASAPPRRKSEMARAGYSRGQLPARN